MPIFFNFKNILAPSVFENAVTSIVFDYLCTMSQRNHVGKILYPCDKVENVEAPPPGTLWGVVSNGSRWVHTNTAITTLSDSSPSYVSKTLQAYKGDICITVSLYGNSSVFLVVVDYGWFNHHTV